MDSSIIAIAGFATFFNFAILRWKFEHDRVADGIVDISVLGIIIFFTAGTMSGMIIGMIASMLFSLYSLWSPFSIDFMDEPTYKGADNA